MFVALPSRSYMVENKDHVLVKVDYFEDGNPNFIIPNLHDMHGKDIIYVADWSTPAARYHDMCVLWPLAEVRPRELTIIIPFMPTATMERESHEGEVATANIDAKMLSALPGHNTIELYDLHTLQNQFFFHDSAILMKSCMPQFAKIFDPSSVIVFPDDGAAKRFKNVLY